MTQKKIPKKFMEWFSRHFTDERDTIDVEHEYDRELSTEENQQAFIKKFFVHYSEDTRIAAAKIRAQQQQQKADEAKNEFLQRKQFLQDRFGIQINFVG